MEDETRALLQAVTLAIAALGSHRDPFAREIYVLLSPIVEQINEGIQAL